MAGQDIMGTNWNTRSFLTTPGNTSLGKKISGNDCVLLTVLCVIGKSLHVKMHFFFYVLHIHVYLHILDFIDFSMELNFLLFRIKETLVSVVFM